MANRHGGVEVICDVDGVVCDFVPYLFDLLRKEGHDIADANDPKWDKWNFFEDMEDSARKLAFEMLQEYSFWRNAYVVNGAVEGIKRLRDAGYKIHWVTTPWWSCNQWLYARMEWLEEHFSDDCQDIQRDLTASGNKATIYADVFIDDKVDNVREWAERNSGLALLYKTNFNRYAHDEMRTITWSTIGSAVEV